MGTDDLQTGLSSPKIDTYRAHCKRRPLGGRTKSLCSQKLQFRAVRLESKQWKGSVVPKTRERYVTQEDIYDLLNDSSKTGNRLSPYAPLPTIGGCPRISASGKAVMNKGTLESANRDSENKPTVINDGSNSNMDRTCTNPSPECDVYESRIENLTIDEQFLTDSMIRDRTYNVLEPRFVKRPASLDSSSDTLAFGPRIGTIEELQGPIKLWDGSSNKDNHSGKVLKGPHQRPTRR